MTQEIAGWHGQLTAAGVPCIGCFKMPKMMREYLGEDPLAVCKFYTGAICHTPRKPMYAIPYDKGGHVVPAPEGKQVAILRSEWNGQHRFRPLNYSDCRSIPKGYRIGRKYHKNYMLVNGKILTVDEAYHR